MNDVAQKSHFVPSESGRLQRNALIIKGTLSTECHYLVIGCCCHLWLIPIKLPLDIYLIVVNFTFNRRLLLYILAPH